MHVRATAVAGGFRSALLSSNTEQISKASWQITWQ
jgi:hypothetical protein